MSSPTPRTVLIVEDDPDSREMFVELLRGGGYSVISTCNGKDAMNFLAVNSPPDVILLDMFMPEMDGWQFRRAQDADPRLAAIPVVVVSAVGAARTSAVRSGAAAFLQKPVAAEDLLSALAKLWPADPALSSPEQGCAAPDPGAEGSADPGNAVGAPSVSGPPRPV